MMPYIAGTYNRRLLMDKKIHKSCHAKITEHALLNGMSTGNHSLTVNCVSNYVVTYNNNHVMPGEKNN